MALGALGWGFLIGAVGCGLTRVGAAGGLGFSGAGARLKVGFMGWVMGTNIN